MSFVIAAEPTRSKCHTALLLASTLVLCAAPLVFPQSTVLTEYVGYVPVELNDEATPAQTATCEESDPSLPVSAQDATAFTKYWLSQALDCDPATRAARHEEAANWTDERAKTYCDFNLWSDQRLEGPVRGPINFQLNGITPVSISRGGSIWVDARGVWNRSAMFSGTKSQCPMEMLILVRRCAKHGLRVQKSYLINDAQGFDVEAFLHGTSRL
ncbi:MAG TPA: hypothetical protein V6C81_15935 [Planktothrix sp.]|jgi:hypothetical protein